MRLEKTVADSITRSFRAEMNKCARDGITRESVFAIGNGVVVEYSVSVQKQIEFMDRKGKK